jgi:hypothetical protein
MARPRTRARSQRGPGAAALAPDKLAHATLFAKSLAVAPYLNSFRERGL